MCWYINICCLLLFYLQSRQIGCSEFPERECCDPIYPLIPDPEPLPPALPTTTISSSSVNPTGRSGPNIKTAIAILNCILARQLCFEDPSCSAILEIIPRVCGPVPVACSTVTVTKCQAALRTLQAFPFFRPTCLCKEPGIDPDCNYFRDFLFDHPCGFVLKKEKDPYPVDALPTCNHALSVCQQERKCIKLFEDFKTHCKVRDNKCRMEDRDSCHEAWTNLRLSPMFGCICPNNHMKRRCDKIFSVVNHNPCVDVFFSALDSSSGTATNSVNTNYFPLESDVEPTAPRKVFPYKYPYFLYPPSHKIPLALASHRPATSDYNSQYHYPSTINAHDSYNISSPYDNLDDSQSTYSKHFNRKNNSLHNNNKLQHQHHIIIDNINNNQENINSNNDNNNNDYLHNLHQFRANRTSSTSDVVRMHKNQQDYVKHRLEIVRAMGMDDNYHRLLDENMALVDTPLIAPSNSYFPQHYKTALYPYNISSYHGNYISSINGIYTPPDLEYERVINNSDPINVDKTQNGPDDDIDPETHPIHFQSTCHIALDSCREDAVCASSLQNILINCDYHKCNRNSCMEALQGFYRNSHEDLSLDAALCLCRKTPNRHDSCMLAKEKLHPICAQRPPENINSQTSSNGIVFNPPPACHQVADLCREDPECRSRLELYEQSCAVDSVTKKCAGKASSCRIALLGILGTPLRTTCACQGSDLQQLYECLGWQRLLWLNPCVVESQKDFHLKRLAELGLLMTTPSTTTHRITRPTTTTTTTTTTTVATTTSTVRYIHVHREHPREPVIKQPAEYYHPTEQQITESNYIDREDPFPILLPNAESNNQNNRDANELPEDSFEVITTEPYDIETTTIPPTTTTVETTTIPIRYCVVQKPHQPDQYIAEGKSRRLYGMDDAECSELCSCSEETLVISCHALCVPLAPCRTSLAYYSHSAPAYQAFRGRCVCYSGRFICMRPPPGEYSLPGGIFLLLGYSSTDEALLRPHTNLGVQDAVRALQQYVTQHINNQTLCSLTLFNISDENIILSVRLPHDQKLNTIELLRKEKDQCTSILETISHQINTQYLELSAHRLLSIFKMAEVQIIWPEINNAISTKRKRMTSLCIIASIIFSFLFSNNINFIHQYNT